MSNRKFLTESDVSMLKNEISKQLNKINTDVFRYYNCNLHHVRTDDCVIRAIAAGMGYSWERVLKELTKYMLKDGHMLNTPELYGKYLEDNGWVKQKQPTAKGGKKVRFKEFVKRFKGCAIAHCGAGHVTYVSEGHVYDIWDPSDEIVGTYWTYGG